MTDPKPTYRDGTTFTAVIAIIRMGAETEYRVVAFARFGRVPTSFDMNKAIERVRRDGVRREGA